MKKILFLSFFAIACAHVCLLKPMQRGGAVIDGPASDSCFQIDGPCGSAKPYSKPIDSWTTGGTMDIQFQQNLNHYVVGNPGHFEFSWAEGPNPTEKDFTMISVIPDFWTHQAAVQTNISMGIAVPYYECEWCVFRVRYMPWNAPNKPVFVQCTDVAFVPPDRVFSSTIAYYTMASMKGLANDAHLIRINNHGEHRDLAPAPTVFKKRQQTSTTYIADGVVAANATIGYLWFMGDDISNWVSGEKPKQLFTFNLHTESWEDTIILQSQGDYWVSFLSGDSEYDFLAIDSFTDDTGSVQYTIYGITNGVASAAIAKTPTKSQYNEFLFADYDHVTNQAYILVTGDGVGVGLWTIALNGTAFNYFTPIDTSSFPIQSFYADDAGVLYAFSPGAFANTTNFFVSINWETGNITEIAAVQENVVPDFRGTVYGDHKFAHKFFTQTDGAALLVMVDSYTGAVTSTNIQNGINNPYKYQSIVGVVTTF